MKEEGKESSAGGPVGCVILDMHPLSEEVRTTMNRGLFTSGSGEYETPQDLFDTLNEEFAFTLDAAATPENAKCERYYTKEDDALVQPWEGPAFCNPPYGRQIADFVKKGYEEYRDGETVVMLLPARTDTKYWHDYVMQAWEIRFIKGRLRFSDTKNSAPFPSCVVVFAGVRNPSPTICSIDTSGRKIKSK